MHPNTKKRSYRRICSLCHFAIMPWRDIILHLIFFFLLILLWTQPAISFMLLLVSCAHDITWFMFVLSHGKYMTTEICIIHSITCRVKIINVRHSGGCLSHSVTCWSVKKDPIPTFNIYARDKSYHFSGFEISHVCFRKRTLSSIQPISGNVRIETPLKRIWVYLLQELLKWLCRVSTK